MTLTPRERASKVVEAFKASDHVFGPDGATPLMESLIASAITQAEDAKLEEAALTAENPGFIEATDTEWDAGVNFAKPFIAKAIRTLKSDAP